MGASIAYHLAELGAEDVVLADREHVGARATSRGMGGVRQQFSTEAEVRLAQASIDFFTSLGPECFLQVGYLFLAATEAGLAELEERRTLQVGLGVPVERVDPSFLLRGLRTDDLAGAVFCATDGVGSPPAVTAELVRRAVALGVEVRERTAAESIGHDLLVIACGAASAELGDRLGIRLPVRPLCRQLLETAPLELPGSLPMTIEAETGFHFRRRGDRLILAMADPEPRWTDEERVDESVIPDRLGRLAHRYPAAAGARIERSWAGLYDMTPDAHPILGRVADGIYAACGFSGHGFMTSPAVGRALAQEILLGGAELDLAPYRLERFADGAIFPERLIL
ncbi:MAG: NAD(P)/FAD-dependent oxidoreductase [Gaiellaceae bacterium]